MHIPQPDADEAPVELTPGAGGPSGFQSMWGNPRHRRRLILGGIAGILVILLIVLLSSQGGRPSPEATPTPGDLTAVPVTLSIKDRSFTVAPVTVTDGRWRVSRGDASSAEWIYGTVINYIFGLLPTPETTELMEGLADNDRVTLDMSTGGQLSFRVSGRQRVPEDAVPDLFQQTRPGITLVLLREGGDERLVVTGLYDADLEQLSAPSTSLAPVGMPTQIDKWRVTVLAGQLAPDPTNPVQANYYVNFTVEYLGDQPVSSDTFEMTLVDGVDVAYEFDPQVSRLGAYSPPGGLVAPRNPTSFTAGYRVSTDIPGPTLKWVFKPTPGTAQPARFEVPIVRPTPTPEPKTQITVQINGASLSTDQTLLVVTGGIGNPTDQSVSIGPADISLSTPDNVFSDVRTAEPALPWTIGPSQTMAFRLEFNRPPGFTAILRIVTQRFELSGLR